MTIDSNSRFSLKPIGIWAESLEFAPLQEASELAAELEEAGYGAIWIPEVAGRDVFVHLGSLLNATRHMVGATGIASIYARDAVTMAGAAKALTEAFPERFVLGLGVSHHNLVEGLRGHRYERPLESMRAYLDALAKSPYTGFRPTTPVRTVLGALGPKMLELAAERTDGAHPYLVPPEHTHIARSILGDHGLLCPAQTVIFETDKTRAREIARRFTKKYLILPNYANNLMRFGFDQGDFEDGGSDRLIDALVAWGDSAAICARVQAHFDAGADHVAVQVLDAEPRGIPVAQWRELAPGLVSTTKSVRYAPPMGS